MNRSTLAVRARQFRDRIPWVAAIIAEAPCMYKLFPGRQLGVGWREREGEGLAGFPSL